MLKKAIMVMCIAVCLGLVAGNALAWNATGTVKDITTDATGTKIRVDTTGGTKGGYINAASDVNGILACALTAQASGATVTIELLSGTIRGIVVYTLAP